MPNTSLTWEVYRSKANTLRGQGLNFPQIYKQLGDPIWNGEQWRLEIDKGKIKRKRKSTRDQNRQVYNKTRQQRDVTKTDAEGAEFNRLKRQASTESDNLIHNLAGGGKPSVAEHDVALQAGGSKEHSSISDPLTGEFKTAVEQYVYAKKPKYIVDIDDVTGGIRLVLKDYHNKFQRVSQQPGRTIEHYEDWRPIVEGMPIVTKDPQLENTLKGIPQQRVSVPSTTASTPKANLSPQTSAPQSKIIPTQQTPLEPNQDLSMPVSPAEAIAKSAAVFGNVLLTASATGLQLALNGFK